SNVTCVRVSPSMNRFMIAPDTISTIRRLDNHWRFHTAWVDSCPSHQAAISPKAATRIQDEHIKFNSSLLIEDLTKQANNLIDTVIGHPGIQCLCFELYANRSDL
ncbi:MAG: hypothetical protein ACRER3_08675, partial [Pseudomonas fluorescens]